MSFLSSINTKMRIDTIKILLRNHKGLESKLIIDSSFNTSATIETLDLIEPQLTLAAVAWDFWNGGGEAEMDKILNLLPQDDFDAFIDALLEYRIARNKIRTIHLENKQHT
ncbi:MAG: hypothetical protein ACN4E2_04780 [Nitrospinota bacterium]